MRTKLLFLLLLVSFSIYAQTNLVTNEGFETWTDNKTLPGWTTQNNVTQNTTDYYGGLNSIKLSFVNNTSTPKITSQIAMRAGITYAIRFKYKYLSSNYSNAHPIVLNINKNGNTPVLSNNAFATDNNWATNEISFTPDSNLTYDLSISLFTSDNIGFNAAIDNVQVYIKGTEQYTLLPDANFEKRLIARNIDSGEIDGRIQTADAASIIALDVTTNVHGTGRYITDITGIQDFTSLTSLDCSGHEIKSLDLSKNSNLITLNCSNNQITMLNISKNAALTYINCGYNKLTNLDVTEKKGLTYLACNYNQLTNLTVSENTALEYLNCQSNKITSLDVSKNTFLKSFYCNNNSLTSLDIRNKKNALFYLNGKYLIDFRLNSQLNCIAVDDVIYSNKNWASNKDSRAKYTMICDQQYTLIPDLNFEKKLIALGIDADSPDGKVLTGSISLQTTLDISNAAIADLTGIQDFTKLKTLNCSGNTLRKLDFSKNLILADLDCSKNELTALNVAKNITLTTLRCSNNNELSFLDVSPNLNLIVLDCKSTNLRTLNVTKNLKLEELNCSYNILPGLDVSKNVHLTSLDCSFNRLPDLNLSIHQSLVSLNCSNNELTSLDVSNTMSLNNFNCSNNKLVNLNVKNGNNLNMPKPNFSGNLNLTCISVDKESYADANWSSAKDKTAFYRTSCGTKIAYTMIPDPAFEDKLIAIGIDTDGKNGKVMTTSITSVTSLDVSNGNVSNLNGIQDFLSLTYLDCGLNGIWGLDLSKNIFLTTLYASQNNMEILNISKNINLTYVDCSKNRLKKLDVSKNTALTYLNLSNNSNTLINVFPELNVSNNTALTTLNCAYNDLTTLDVSKNLALTTLNCNNNKLDVLDITKNTALTTFNCRSNSLQTLDLSKNTALTKFSCNYNRLWYLNLKNGNNINLNLTDSNFTNNPNLTCIQVDDTAYSNANWSGKKDATATFNETCEISYTLIPDINFEKRLIALKIDSGTPDGKVATARISYEPELELYGNSISDLTGIQDFKALTSLKCQNNQLTTLDLSQNLALLDLDVSNNKLTNLPISKNINLNELICTSNQLTTLTISSNKKLNRLWCGSNQLTTLDFSKNSSISDLRCHSNQLTNLDLSSISFLYVLICSENNLSTLNLKNGGNKILFSGAITSFKNNPNLSCIQVDDVAYSDKNWSELKDATASYKTACNALGLEESVFNKAVIHPNPTKGEVNIQNASLEKATVYNSLGQLVKSFTLNSSTTHNTIDLSGLPKGVYYVYLINGDAASAKKIIVE